MTPLFNVPAAGHTLALGRRPWLMGVVNTSPESFSDGGSVQNLDVQVARAARLLAEGADLIDVAGESATTNQPPLSVSEEINRVVPLIERISTNLGALVSVDTYKPQVAEAAIAAGAVMVNDVSGLKYSALADVCARTGAALVVMHTSAPPKQRLQDTDLYADITAEVAGFLADRMGLAIRRGVPVESIILDPGPDFSKTPPQTIELLRNIGELHKLDRPLLMAVSRKDFIGALTDQPPQQRLPGTLAAIGHSVDAGGHILRLHDVGAARDYLTVRGALRGELPVDRTLLLDDALRHQR